VELEGLIKEGTNLPIKIIKGLIGIKELIPGNPGQKFKYPK